MLIYAIIEVVLFGVAISLIFILILIPKKGLQFLMLKCPNCNKIGGLRKTWRFTTEKEIDDGVNIDIIDVDLEIEK